MSSLARLILATSKGTPPPPATDTNFKNVVALLHGTGTNGTQNNVFSATGPGGGALSLSLAGAPAEGSFTPYGSAWSANLPSSSTSYLTYGASTSAGPANNTFTMECWALFETLPTTLGPNGIFCFWQKGRTGTSNFELAFGLILDQSGTGGYQISYQVSGNGTTVTNVNSPNLSGLTTGVWHHFAITQVSGSGIVNYWFDGTNVGSSNHGVTNMFVGTGAAAIGNNNAGANPQFVGYVSNVRIVFGSRVYTTNFTPPTSPLTAITGTNFLGCQSSYVADKSTNAWTITSNGAPSVQRLNPFGANGTAYSTTSYGGSAYLDGASYFDTPANGNYQLTADFTIEYWVYQFVLGGNRHLCYWTTGTPTQCAFLVNIGPSGTINFAYGSGSTNNTLTGTTAKATINSWNHVAVTRQGTTVRIFVNGVMDASTFTVSGSLNTTAGTPLYIGADNTGSGGSIANIVTGYMSDVRIVNGTALYTASFTPPTAPLSAVTNTVFLYKAQSAGSSGVFDNAMQQAVVTNGTAKISTAQSKFAGSSWAFDGSSTCMLTIPNQLVPVWGTLDWTIEGWFYITTYTANSTNGLFGFRNGINYGSMALGINNGILQALASTSSSSWTYNHSAASAIATGTWLHLAMVRSGTVITVYQNGTSIITGTQSGSLYQPSVPFTIGSTNTVNGSGNLTFTGYVNDFRMTFGIARYIANFTPSGSTFPNQ